MYQKFNEDLSKQEIYANGRELATIMWMDRDEEGKKVYSYPDTEKALVATIEDPVLVSDSSAILQQVKEYFARETALLLISKWYKVTEYDGTVLPFDQNKYPTLWWPNMDTMFFCKGMNEVDLSGVKHAIEICAGTGYIWRYVQDKLESQWVTDYFLEYNDINEQALKYYQDNNNTARNSSYNGRVDFNYCDARSILKYNKYDLILCNPPYIPRKWSIENNAYEGLELITFLLTEADSFLNPEGKLIINISSLAKPVAIPLLNKLEENWRKVKVVMPDMEVPLKVFNVLNNKERRNEILSNPGIIIKPEHAHEYWHTLSLFEISRK